MNAPATIKGWCPTALRPMMSGDGLLVRVRVRDATLSPAHALALADAAKRFGNGLLELTQRANIQIRGVQPENFAPLLDLLSQEGLADAREGGVPINILVDSLCDLDASARDMRPLAAAIERGLLSDECFAALPSKFGFALDGGGTLSLGETRADVSITATGAGEALVAPAGFGHVARMPVADAPATALAFARAFLTLRQDERRMRALAHVGDDALFAQVGLPMIVVPPSARSTPEPLGYLEIGNRVLLGVSASFGAWHADDLAAVARLAGAHSGTTIRVTPWRALLIAGLPEQVAEKAFEEFAARDLIVRADDVRRRIAACAGAPACSSGEVQTRTLAKTLAPLLAPGPDIAFHVSGCEKGCAHPRRAPVTFVGRNGCFDLIFDGRADDAPRSIGLDSEGALATLAQRRAA